MYVSGKCMAHAYPPPATLFRGSPGLLPTRCTTPGPELVPKWLSEVVFLAQNSVAGQNSKELCKINKYFQGSEPVFGQK